MDIRVAPFIHHGGRNVGSSGRVRVIVPDVTGNELLLTQTIFEVSSYPNIVTLCYETAYNVLSRDKKTKAHAVLFLRDSKPRCGGNELAVSSIAKKDDTFSYLFRNIQLMYFMF
jgi:hypothetical protein